MSKHKKKNKIKTNGIVKLSSLALIVGIISTSLFMALDIFSIVKQESIFIIIVVSLLMLLGVILIVAYINCRVHFDPVKFTYKNFFGVKNTYFYDDITAIKYGTSSTNIYVGNKKLSVESIADNYNEFLFLVKTKNKRMETVKSKIFNDNVSNPEEFIFIYVLFIVMFIGMIIFVNVMEKDLAIKDLNCITTTITNYEQYTDNDGDINLSLTLDGYNPNFVVWYYEDMENLSQFESAVSSEKEFNIYYPKTVEDVENTGSHIVMLSDVDNVTYLALDTFNGRTKDTKIMISLIFAVLLIIWIVMGILSNFILCNADRFPKLARLLVKESYLKC